jgi:hypothetical protein
MYRELVLTGHGLPESEVAGSPRLCLRRASGPSEETESDCASIPPEALSFVTAVVARRRPRWLPHGVAIQTEDAVNECLAMLLAEQGSAFWDGFRNRATLGFELQRIVYRSVDRALWRVLDLSRREVRDLFPSTPAGGGRRRAIRPRHQELVDEQQLVDQIASDVESRDRRIDVRAALQTLEPKVQYVLIARVVSRTGWDKIASEQGVSTYHVQACFHKAIHTLSQYLRSYSAAGNAVEAAGL